jgi:hypothetical protein
MNVAECSNFFYQKNVHTLTAATNLTRSRFARCVDHIALDYFFILYSLESALYYCLLLSLDSMVLTVITPQITNITTLFVVLHCVGSSSI